MTGTISLPPNATREQLLAKIAELEAQAAEKAKLTIRKSEKGAVMVLGLQRFPVTLYWQQWERLLDIADDIRAFIKANKSELSTK